MNNWNGIGRLTNDIELRYTQNRTAVGRFTLAVNRMRKEDGADFISCKVWSEKAEIMEKYIKKGHLVGIKGRIETGSYEKDGHKVYTTEVVVEDFDFLEKRQQPSQNAPDLPEDFVPVDDSDLPF